MRRKGMTERQRKFSQWLYGFIVAFLVVFTLAECGLTRMMAPEVAKPALAIVISQLGVATAKDAQGIADQIYEGKSALGAEEQQGLGFLSNINSKNYNDSLVVGTYLWVLVDIFGIGLFLLGKGYGRLLGLGVTVLAATLITLFGYEAVILFLHNPGAKLSGGLTASALQGFIPALQAGYTQTLHYLWLALIFSCLAVIGYLATRNSVKGAVKVAAVTNNSNPILTEPPFDYRIIFQQSDIGKAFMMAHALKQKHNVPQDEYLSWQDEIIAYYETKEPDMPGN